MREPWEPIKGKAQHLHPQTSHDAARDNAPAFGTQRWLALAALNAAYPGALTVAEITERIGMRSRNQASTRVMELREQGWAERVTEPRTNEWLTKPTGPSAEGVLHRITKAGRSLFPSLRRPIMVPIDRARLRSLLNEMPEPVKHAVRDALAGKPPLSDDAYDAAPPMLYQVTTDCIAAAETAGYVLPYPVDTAPYQERTLSLPDDLTDAVVLEARTYKLPHFAHPHLWTAEQGAQLGLILQPAEDEAETRRKRVHAVLTEAGLNADEDRHAIIDQLTAGRTNSSRGVTRPEVEALVGWLQEVRAGQLAFARPAMKLVDKSGVVLGPYACDWRAYGKAKGLPVAHLNKLARGAAERLGLPVPGKASDVVDHRLTAAVWRLVDAEAAMATLTEGGLPVEEDEAYPPEALAGPEAPEGHEDGGEAPGAAPEATGGPQRPVPRDLAAQDQGEERSVLVPVPLSRLRAVLETLGW